MGNETQDDEVELLRRMRSGQSEAAMTLYERHSGPVYRFALNMTGSPSIAEEATQEAFLELLKEEPYQPSRGPILPWLLGVARNKARQALRLSSTTDSLDMADTPEIASPQNVVDDLTSEEQRDLLRQAIASLPVTLREVVLLCELQELDYASAALVLGCPVGTVRSRLHRARAFLNLKLRSRCLV